MISGEVLLDGLFRGGRFLPVKDMRRRVLEARALLDAIRAHGFEVKAAVMPIDADGAPDDDGVLMAQVVAVPLPERPSVRGRLLAKHGADVVGASRSVRNDDDAEEVLDAINLAARELLGVVRGL